MISGAQWVADVTTPQGQQLTGNGYRVVEYHVACQGPNGARALSKIATYGGLGHSSAGRKFHCQYSHSTLKVGHNGVCWTGPRSNVQTEFAFTADLKTGH